MHRLFCGTAILGITAAWTATPILCETWDNNWDKRDPNSYPKQNFKKKKDSEIKEGSVSRILLLVRHGQYDNVGHENDSLSRLTELGRHQAELTGNRISQLLKYYENNGKKPSQIRCIHSTMLRATETAAIIRQYLPQEHECFSDNLLQEGAPCQPSPPIEPEKWNPSPYEFYSEGQRIEAAFRKYFYRADEQEKRECIDILVCHGNVIRYFVCRALQNSPEGWLRMSLHNASISTITIFPDGHVSLSAFGDSGHLPIETLTYT